MIKYREFEIRINPPAARYIRYGYNHQDYDGPGDSRRGHCRTLQACKDEIDEYWSEYELRKQTTEEHDICDSCGDCMSLDQPPCEDCGEVVCDGCKCKCQHTGSPRDMVEFEMNEER